MAFIRASGLLTQKGRIVLHKRKKKLEIVKDISPKKIVLDFGSKSDPIKEEYG